MQDDTPLHFDRIDLPKFDGTDLTLFLRQFRSLAYHDNWSEKKKVKILFQCLQGETRRYIEEGMSYDECIHALTQFYGHGRPSVKSKNLFRNFKKAYNETIEEYTSRIMSFADGCRLDPETKKLYMHLAFMNGISYDPAMQRYIEKHTNEQPVVKIVDLMAAAQRYMHNKTGTSGAQKDRTGRRNDPNHYSAARAGRGNQPSDQVGQAPQLNVLKTGRKDSLHHDDPNVSDQVESEHEKVQQEKAEKASARAAASRREFEIMQGEISELRELLRQQTATAQSGNNDAAQAGTTQRPRYNNYRGNGRYNNNYRGGYGGSQQRNYNNNYRGGRGGYNNPGYNGNNDGGSSNNA